MVTAHNSAKYVKKEIDGISVHYLPVKYDTSMGFIKRVWSFIKFTIQSIRLAKKLPKHDICYATSTPLTVGIIALRLKKKIKLPYYFEVRDLWPEAPIQMGIIKNFLLIRLLRALESRIYNNAEKLIALSPGIRDSISAIAPGKKVFLIPNMSDIEFFKPRLNLGIEEKYKVTGKFVVTYFGAIGKVNHLEYFLDVIEEVKKKGMDLKFFIVGKGNSYKEIKEKANAAQLHEYLTFLPFKSKEGLKEVLEITHAAYISFANKPILSTNSPNKFFDALSAGKLIVINHKGWLNDIIQSHNCGFYVNPCKPEKFIDKITPYMDNEPKLLKAQRNARELAELYYSKELQIEKILKVFDNEYVMRLNEDQVYTLTA